MEAANVQKLPYGRLLSYSRPESCFCIECVRMPSREVCAVSGRRSQPPMRRPLRILPLLTLAWVYSGRTDRHMDDARRIDTHLDGASFVLRNVLTDRHRTEMTSVFLIPKQTHTTLSKHSPNASSPFTVNNGRRVQTCGDQGRRLDRRVGGRPKDPA